MFKYFENCNIYNFLRKENRYTIKFPTKMLISSYKFLRNCKSSRGAILNNQN